MMRDGILRWDVDPRITLRSDEAVVNIPCRKCMGCGAAESRDWSVRCFHEALEHTKDWRDPDTGITTNVPNSCVITLTYRPEDYPEDGALHHEDFQLFMKRLRERLDEKIRFFMCGEFGGQTGRGHFHSIIFGETFDDRWQDQSNGKTLHHSHLLDETWGKGRATVDDFSFAGAAYVAGYVAKKINVHQTGPVTEIVDKNGEVFYKHLSPEYRKMSTRPVGLGGKWIQKPENMAKVYENDCCQVSEWTFHPPRYYDTLLKRQDPGLYDQVVGKRLDGMAKHAGEWSPERCAAAEKIALESLQQRLDSL